MEKIDTKTNYYILTALKERGWTASLIKKYLGAPDLIKKNFSYNNFLKLYLIERVNNIENTEEFLADKEKSKIRSNRGKKTAEQKAVKLLNKTRQWVPKIKNVPKDKVIKYAISAYNNWNCEKYDVTLADENSDQAFLDRITVNYIRHNLTEYDYELDDLFGKVGKQEAVFTVKCIVLDKIGELYPYLADECIRQKEPFTDSLDI